MTLYVLGDLVKRRTRKRRFLRGKLVVWIDNSRIVAVIAVIFLHASAGRVSTINDIDSISWWISNIFDSLVMWCVPVFVMISGSLLLNITKEESLSTFYRKRISRILIPLLFWSAFYMGIDLLKKIINSTESNLHSIGFMNLISDMLSQHLWFLYMIIGLYLVTPFLRKITSNSTKNELVVLVAALFILATIDFAYTSLYVGNATLLHNWFLLYLPYFMMGDLLIKIQKAPPKPVLMAVFLLSLAMTSIGSYLLFKYAGLNKRAYFYGYLSITVIPMSFCIIMLLKEIATPIIDHELAKKLARLTFGVYLIHPIFFGLFRRNIISLHPALYIPLLTAISFACSLVAVWMIDRIPYVRRII